HNMVSDKKKISAAISATGKYFDGDQLSNAWLVENADIAPNLNRAWGVSNKVLLKDIPADTVDVNIVVKFAIYQEDRLAQLLGAVKGAEPIPGVSSVEPYMTYANLIDGMMKAIFKTDKQKF